MAYMNSDLNVLHSFPYAKRYYLFHPWLFFIDLWKNIKAAKQRVTKGYCSGDVWDMDSWFCIVIPQMLRRLATDGLSCPIDNRFKTLAEWHDYLNSIADLLEASNNDVDEQNEYAEKFYRAHHSDPDYGEIKQNYLDRKDQIYKEQQIMCISAMNNLSELISSKMLWD